MMLDEPFAGVDPIAVHDIQSIVAGLRTKGIGVLISDHNVEQTLDIVDRAYIMFDGQVKVSGTVRELVFDEEVSRIYLGPTLDRAPARPVCRRRERPVKHGLSQSTSLRQELKINPRLYQAMDLLYMPLLDLQQHLKQELLVNPFLELIEPEEDDEEAEQENEEEGTTAATDLAGSAKRRSPSRRRTAARSTGRKSSSMDSTRRARASSTKSASITSRFRLSNVASTITFATRSRCWT